MDRPAGAGFPTERPGAFTCGWPDGQPCGLPTRPPTGRRLPTSSTGPHHGRWRSTSNTPPAAQASQAPQRPPRRPPTSPSALVPTISTAQPSTEPQIGHVPEIIGHVRRNAHRSGGIALACTTRPDRSTACTWNTRLDRSTPTRATGARVISTMDFSFPFRLNFRKSILVPRYRHRTGEVPSYSFNRTRYGKAPWPRCARCLSCASRPGRLASARRLPLRSASQSPTLTVIRLGRRVRHAHRR